MEDLYTEYIDFALKTVRGVLGDDAIVSHAIVGSTYIQDVGPSAFNTRDLDILVLVSEYGPGPMEIGFEGWAYGGSVGEGNDSLWGSWKRSYNGLEVNLLVTGNREYYYKWLTAAEVCRYISLMQDMACEREDDYRIGIHNIIMDDSTAEYEIERMKA